MEPYQDLIAVYLQAAETYTQLAVGALLVTVVFRDKIVKTEAAPRRLLILTWVLLLLSIGCGALFPYLAGHFLARMGGLPLDPSWLPSYLERNPGVATGAQMIFFYAGAVALVVTHIADLRRSDPAREAHGA